MYEQIPLDEPYYLQVLSFIFNFEPTRGGVNTTATHKNKTTLIRNFKNINWFKNSDVTKI